MIWLTAIGAILCGWATLAVVGGERQRRLDRLQLLRASARRAASPDAGSKASDAKPRSAWPGRASRAAIAAAAAK